MQSSRTRIENAYVIKLILDIIISVNNEYETSCLPLYVSVHTLNKFPY